MFKEVPDELWNGIAPLLARFQSAGVAVSNFPRKHSGGKPALPQRQILPAGVAVSNFPNGILYVLTTGCQMAGRAVSSFLWEMLPLV